MPLATGTWSAPAHRWMPTFEWWLWRDGPRAGPDNMAIDQALLERAGATGQAVLRLYAWDPPCLSFGAHEPATRRYDRPRIARLAFPCVRRPTGGRAVYHHGELTYALASPLDRFGSLRSAYHEIHAMLAAALRAVGISATLAPFGGPVPGVAAGSCFDTAAGGEVLVAGRKLIGSAQVRTRTALLQHGSLLLRDDQSLVRELAAGAGSTPDSLAAPRPATLESLRAEKIQAGAPDRPEDSWELMAAAIAEAAPRAWPGRWQPLDPAPVLQEATRHLSRFSDPAWTWRQ